MNELKFIANFFIGTAFFAFFANKGGKRRIPDRRTGPYLNDN